jgi:hypothetical protein
MGTSWHNVYALVLQRQTVLVALTGYGQNRVLTKNAVLIITSSSRWTDLLATVLQQVSSLNATYGGDSNKYSDFSTFGSV